MSLLLENGKGFCPWCKQGTAFERVHRVHYAAPTFGGVSTTFNVGYESPARTGILIFRCMHCEQSVVLLEHQVMPVEGLSGGRIWRTMVAPGQTPRALDEAAPEGVRSLFAEASKCEKAGAMRGAGVLYRAAVEELVKGQGGTGKDLYTKITSLKGQLLSDELIEDLHEARLLGNYSIHDGIEFSAQEVADVADLITEAVLVLYVQPEQKRAMRDARKARTAGPAVSGDASSEAPKIMPI